jgi:hypothetical protein
MVQVLQAEKINLATLKANFDLVRAQDPDFFNEWQGPLPDLTETEQQILAGIKADYLHLAEDYPVVEAVVKLVVVSPLLKLAGFYQPPFYIAAEQMVEVTSEEQDLVIRGRLDLLTFTPDFWVMLIETKSAKYSLEVGIPQALTYMFDYLLDRPAPDRPAFGLVTNGSEFRFLKLMKQKRWTYGRSNLFALDSRDDLAIVAQILKHLAQVVREFS